MPCYPMNGSYLTLSLDGLRTLPARYRFSYGSYFLLLVLSVASNGQPADDSCLQQSCGNVSVPYPFTFGPNSTCPSFKLSTTDSNFTLNCTNDVLYFYINIDVPVLQILADSLILNLSSLKATNVNKEGICNVTSLLPYDVSFGYRGPYISAADNHFGSFGCSLGVLVTLQNENSSAYDVGGCEPLCGFDGSTSLIELNTSTYNGCGDSRNCCISSFPSTARITQYALQTLPNDSSPCSSFAIPFHPNFTNFSSNTYGFRVLWALPDPNVAAQLKALNSTARNFSVAELHGDIQTACTPGKSSQVSVVSEIEPGYRCSCLPGYRGDGYKEGSGCADIDECSSALPNLCVEQAECRNEPEGSFTCHCTSPLHVGDGRRDGVGCRLSPTLIKVLEIVGAILGFVVFVSSIIAASIVVGRRRKRMYFKQNGGFELQAYITAATGRQTTKLFREQELKDATQNFSEHLKLGTGGSGTVYRGTLNDGRVVAVKKGNQAADRHQFLNEMTILTQIHHKNIVRLYGCCLETVNPLLVYEFVTNGDLAEKLASKELVMGWAERLQVATQVADALGYLHTKLSQPVLHRDVKTANILLDDNLEAKVADFGISRLIPEGQNCVSTVVQGTLGYLDPEYFQTLQLTDKSDVYSLGVVLVELITGQKAVDAHSRGFQSANLALLFLDRMKADRVHELVDPRLEEAVNAAANAEAKWRLHNSLQDVGRLAQRCLAMTGTERPSMNELAQTLLEITTEFTDHGHDNADEVRPLLLAGR